MSLAGVISVASPAQAATGNILPPFDIGQTWYICQGYSNSAVTHTGTSQYGLDLTGGPNCDNSAANRNVRAPMSGTVSYYQAAYGNLCLNVAGGRSVTLTHINSSLESGIAVDAGEYVGKVASAGSRQNGNVAHIHFQMWDAPNCYNSSVMPFDSAHDARICGAPDLTASGPNGGNGVWSGTSFTGATCGTTPPPPPPVPVVDNVFFVNTGWDINWEYYTQFGQDGDKAVVGDFDGNGTDTPAVYRGNTFYVNTGWDGNYEFSTQFGQAGDQPLVGDWDGDGIDTPAVRRGNVFYVNTGWDSNWEYSVTFGQSGDQAMVGDWDGNGTDTPAVYRGNTFYVNTGWDANWEFSTAFGQSGDKALVGDWTGGGIDTPAVHRGNTFYVNTGWDGNYEFSTQFGETADHSLVGDWDGEGLDTPAVRREILT